MVGTHKREDYMDTPTSLTRRGHRLNWMYVTSNLTTVDFSFHVPRLWRVNDIGSSHKKWRRVSTEFPYFVSIPYFSSIFEFTGQYPICIFIVTPVTDGNFVEIDWSLKDPLKLAAILGNCPPIISTCSYTNQHYDPYKTAHQEINLFYWRCFKMSQPDNWWFARH